MKRVRTFRHPIACWVLLGLALAASVSRLSYADEQSAVRRPPPQGATAPRLQLLVPAYFYPAGAGQAPWDALLAGVAKSRIGYTFVTDDEGANPWDRLPSYWDQEVSVVAALNAQRDPARK